MRFSISILSFSSALVFAGSAFAGALPTQFSSLDKDSNSRVTFAEYKAFAEAAQGLSATEAAQDFVRAAQGDAILTEKELSRALLVEGKAYALKPEKTPKAAIPLGPRPLSDVQDVKEEPIYGYESIPPE